MIKKNVTPKEVVDFLNELLKVDRRVVEGLCGLRIACNKKLAKHPTVQVGVLGKTGNYYVVGIIGILNGLFGSDENGWGCISMDVKENKINKFEVLEKKRRKNQ